MTYPKELKYTKDHEWIDLKKDGTAVIGITDYALEQLGDVVFLELPKVGDALKKGDSFGTIESTKTVSDLYAPANGEVLDVNKVLTGEQYDVLTDDPYGQGWLLKIRIDGEAADLLTADDYESYISEQD